MHTQAISFLFLIIPVLLNVAFFTLLERKILGLSQSRKGPNKTAIGGYLQPFSDALKLFAKESVIPGHSNPTMFTMSPAMGMFLILWLWALVPNDMAQTPIELSALTLLVIMGLGLYPLLVSGWASNSKYAMVGAMRGIAQTISYEISLALVLFGMLVISESLSVNNWMGASEYLIWGMVGLPSVVLWWVSCVAETNRTPFDFAEGESELVSGFNIEYGSGGFALIFMAEYASILVLSTLTGLLVVSATQVSTIGAMGAISLCWGWVWIRATYPRYRYDMLMGLAWKSVLPLTLGVILYLSALVVV